MPGEDGEQSAILNFNSKIRLPSVDVESIIHSVDRLPLRQDVLDIEKTKQKKDGWFTRVCSHFTCCCCSSRRPLYTKKPYNAPNSPNKGYPSAFSNDNRPGIPAGGVALGPQRDCDVGKKTLILDLDETLVHSSFKPVDAADFVVPVRIADGDLTVYVLKRPWLEQFLEQAGRHFEVVVFTASLQKYAHPVVDQIDKHGSVRTRLYREHCLLHAGNYVKELTCLGRDMRHCILVDNSPHSWVLQPENALPIATFMDDPDDRGLLELLPSLMELLHVDDVRQHLHRFHI